jgi:hypothetical protein
VLLIHECYLVVGCSLLSAVDMCVVARCG